MVRELLCAVTGGVKGGEGKIEVGRHLQDKKTDTENRTLSLRNEGEKEERNLGCVEGVHTLSSIQGMKFNRTWEWVKRWAEKCPGTVISKSVKAKITFIVWEGRRRIRSENEMEREKGGEKKRLKVTTSITGNLGKRSPRPVPPTRGEETVDKER